MIINERESRREYLLNAAKQMMTAARTAPKGKGIDVIEIALVEGDDILVLSEKTHSIGEEKDLKFFLRDALSIQSAEAVVLIGTRFHTQGLNCMYCGFPCCSAKQEKTPCAINAIDLGIAIGSACATASDLRLDTRVMFSVGMAAQELNWLSGCKCVFAIPVSASTKNPFFDRVTQPAK
jgi:uncharacterized ferredoxin-like protein